jgi:hypothetical protein
MTAFKEQLLGALAKIKGSGTFVSAGIQPFIFPGMELKSLGEISFPVSASEVKKMIKLAHKAPFGKGSKTVLDPAVRSAWEIDASMITFKSNSWNKFIEKVVKQVKPDLGIEDRDVSANLYKLLIYEKGDFFLSHKDSEKEPGMFGSLIIGLPSKHEGGELLVSFNGRTQTIDFSLPENQYQLPFAAFYADCEHEIKPIRSGYRVCLVYNLVKKEGGEKIRLQPLENVTDQLASILKTSEEDKDIPKIVLLEHQYTPTNFTMDALKLNDRPKAETLLLAAEKAGFYAKLGLVTSYRIGELDLDSGKRKHRSSRGRWYDDFYDEESVEDATMGEVFDEYVEVEHWMPGGIPPLREIEFEEKDLISASSLNEGEPIEKNVTDYTGNAGMEMEYWYHYGAVFLWPRKYHYDMLIDLPSDNKLDWIAYYNRHWDTIKKEDIVLVKKLIEAGFHLRSHQKELDFDPLAEWLFNLNDEKYLVSKAANLLVTYFSQISIVNWLKLFLRYPPKHLASIFDTTGQMGEAKSLKHLLIILNHLSSSEKTLRSFVMAQVKQIPSYVKAINLVNIGKETTKGILQETLTLSELISGNKVWLKETSEAFTRTLTRSLVNDVLVAVILESGKNNILGRILLGICIKDLKSRIENKPQPPKDWSRPVPDTGLHKKEWKILKSFLKSPTLQVFDYQKIQADRTEMEYAIRSVTIDLRMETIRKGSPHILRITKTQKAYEKELANWNEDVNVLKKIVQ